jgi:hypothetical protein
VSWSRKKDVDRRQLGKRQRMNPTLKKLLLITAEVLLVLAILALLAANWLPIMFGARPYKVAPP